jgi:dihydroxy-acid dehydratase
MIPSGTYALEDLDAAGGVPAVMNELKGLLHLELPTVSGKTVGANIKDAKVLDRSVIRPLADPVHKEGGIAILTGNLAPKGSVIKTAGVADQHAQTHWAGKGLRFRKRSSYCNTRERN